MYAGDPAALANEAHEAGNHFWIGKDRPNDAVKEDRIVFLNLRIFQVVEIVAERGRERLCLLGGLLNPEIPVRDRAVIEAALRAQIDHQQLSWLLGRRRGEALNGRLNHEPVEHRHAVGTCDRCVFRNLIDARAFNRLHGFRERVDRLP